MDAGPREEEHSKRVVTDPILMDEGFRRAAELLDKMPPEVFQAAAEKVASATKPHSDFEHEVISELKAIRLLLQSLLQLQSIAHPPPR